MNGPEEIKQRNMLFSKFGAQFGTLFDNFFKSYAAYQKLKVYKGDTEAFKKAVAEEQQKKVGGWQFRLDKINDILSGNDSSK